MQFREFVWPTVLFSFYEEAGEFPTGSSPGFDLPYFLAKQSGEEPGEEPPLGFWEPALLKRMALQVLGLKGCKMDNWLEKRFWAEDSAQPLDWYAQQTEKLYMQVCVRRDCLLNLHLARQFVQQDYNATSGRSYVFWGCSDFNSSSDSGENRKLLMVRLLSQTATLLKDVKLKKMPLSTDAPSLWDRNADSWLKFNALRRQSSGIETAVAEGGGVASARAQLLERMEGCLAQESNVHTNGDRYTECRQEPLNTKKRKIDGSSNTSPGIGSAKSNLFTVSSVSSVPDLAQGGGTARNSTRNGAISISFEETLLECANILKLTDPTPERFGGGGGPNEKSQGAGVMRDFFEGVRNCCSSSSSASSKSKKAVAKSKATTADTVAAHYELLLRALVPHEMRAPPGKKGKSLPPKGTAQSLTSGDAFRQLAVFLAQSSREDEVAALLAAGGFKVRVCATILRYWELQNNLLTTQQGKQQGEQRGKQHSDGGDDELGIFVFDNCLPLPYMQHLCAVFDDDFFTQHQYDTHTNSVSGPCPPPPPPHTRTIIEFLLSCASPLPPLSYSLH
jgi:hypothetical protein